MRLKFNSNWIHDEQQRHSNAKWKTVVCFCSEPTVLRVKSIWYGALFVGARGSNPLFDNIPFKRGGICSVCVLCCVFCLNTFSKLFGNQNFNVSTIKRTDTKSKIVFFSNFQKCLVLKIKSTFDKSIVQCNCVKMRVFRQAKIFRTISTPILCSQNRTFYVFSS